MADRSSFSAEISTSDHYPKDVDDEESATSPPKAKRISIFSCTKVSGRKK